MVFRPNVDDHLCFVLIPLRDPFLEYYEKIIKPAAKNAGLDCLQSQEIYGTGAIIHDIWAHIWRAKIIIADVTGKNPNVNYELGICHSLNVPTILLSQRIDDVPFDYRHRRCIPYDTTQVGWDSLLRESIERTIEKAIASAEPESELQWPYDTFVLKGRGSASSLISHENARTVVVQGAGLVRDSLTAAFGPNGTSVELVIAPGVRGSYKEGAQIAAGIRSSNPLEARGVDAMRQLAVEARNAVGDATKTAVILAHAMLKSGNEAIERGFLPKSVTRGMGHAVEVASGFLAGESMSPNADDLRCVARTAAEGDGDIASLVVDALNRIGKDGIIAVEETTDTTSSVSAVEGMNLTIGYISEHFVNSPERQECVLENCYVLAYEHKISVMSSFLPILEAVATTGRPLLVIADDVEGEALATLVINKLRGILSCCAVRIPAHGDRRRALFEDIALVVGAKALTRDLGSSLESVRLADLGTAGKVIVKKENTTIVDGGGPLALIEARVSAIKRQIQDAASDWDREKLRERLANLAGGVAILKAGGVTASDVREARYKIQSALYAATSSLEEGYVLGGGQALFRASLRLSALAEADEASNAGIRAVSDALKQPIQTLIENAKRSATQMMSTLESSPDEDLGFDALSGNLADLKKLGILDAAKSLRTAVALAFSHAKRILETGAWELNEASPEKKIS